MRNIIRPTTRMNYERLHAEVGHKKIALMMNSSVVDERARCLLDILHDDWCLDISYLFGMEHGVRGEQLAGVQVKSATDPGTGLPVYSLYDYPEWKPPVDLLRQVDAVIFSAQDIGVRHWTFTSWLMYLVKNAAEAGCEVYVLDRPNPITGTRIEGNLTCAGFFSLVGAFPYPLRHGMTMGELAVMYNEEYHLGCKLKIIPLEGYSRDMWYEETGLLWVPPSPNMPTVETALAFATTGLIQGMNVSFGCGTTTPFFLVGAPWIDGTDLAGKLNTLDIPGVIFMNKYFEPTHSRYEKELCNAVLFRITDKEIFMPVATQIHIITILMRDYGEKITFVKDQGSFDERCGSTRFREQLLAGECADTIIEEWNILAKEFAEKRSNYLLYR